MKAIEKAVSFLHDNLAQKSWEENGILPPYRKLAHSAGVSASSMIKAISLLKKEGRLFARQGSGIFIRSDCRYTTTANTLQPEKQKWERVAETMKKDFLNNTLPGMPNAISIKELIAHYRTSFRVVKKAIAFLVKEGLLEADKKNYRVLKQIQAANVFCIYLIMKSEVLQTELYPWDIENLESFSSTLEHECSARRIQLIKCTPEEILKKKDHAKTLGFILWQTSDIWLTSRNVDWIISTLTVYKKPVVILDDNIVSTAQFLEKLSPLRQMTGFLFAIQGPTQFEAGLNFGKFLLTKGRKQVCCFGFSREQKWMVDCYTGISQAFVQAGRGNVVHSFFSLDVPLENQTDNAVADKIARQEDFLSNMIGIFEKQSDFDPPRIPMKIMHFVRQFNMAQHGYRRMLVNLDKAIDLCTHKSVWVGMETFFPSYIALDYLRKKKDLFPERIGVAGFGNRLENSFDNITTYNFNYGGIAKQTINSITYPELAQKLAAKNKGGILRVEGFVMDRGSV